MYTPSHHAWEFIQTPKGHYLARREDGEKRIYRETLAEFNALLDFFRDKGFFVRTTKALRELTAR